MITYKSGAHEEWNFSIWNRCSGIYISPTIYDQKEDGDSSGSCFWLRVFSGTSLEVLGAGFS